MMAGDTPEKTFENTFSALKQQIKYSPDEVGLSLCAWTSSVFLSSTGNVPYSEPRMCSPQGCINVPVDPALQLLVWYLTNLCAYRFLPLTAAPCLFWGCLQLPLIMIEAVTSCSHKTIHYALLVGKPGALRNRASARTQAPFSCMAQSCPSPCPHESHIILSGDCLLQGGQQDTQDSLCWCWPHACVLCCAGMVNVEDAEWVKGLMEAAGNTFAQQLADGQVNGPRLLLRFFAALTHTSVLLPADVLSLMERIMEVAQAQAAAGTSVLGLLFVSASHDWRRCCSRSCTPAEWATHLCMTYIST